MNFILSNGWFAWIAALLSVLMGAVTYLNTGLAPQGSAPLLDPEWAVLAALAVTTFVFYVAFGVLSMHWFGWKYWALALIWNSVWFVALLLLGAAWLETLGRSYAFLTAVLVWRLVPDGELNDRLRNGGRK
jgi:hypothetical protein